MSHFCFLKQEMTEPSNLVGMNSHVFWACHVGGAPKKLEADGNPPSKTEKYGAEPITIIIPIVL